MRYFFIILFAIIFSACADKPMQSILNEVDFIPKIEINTVAIKSIKLDSISLESNISITNPLPLNINIKDAMINLYYEDKIINSYRINGENTLQARSTSNIILDSDIRINDLVKIIKDYPARDSIPFKFEVTTSLFALIPNITKEYNLREKFDINIPTINPKISLKNIDFTLKSGFKAVFNIKNETKAKFSLEDISYILNINGIELNGIAKTNAQSDNSIDIILKSQSQSIKINNDKKIALTLKANTRIGDIPYTIPLNIDKTF
ncbi:MAG: hypothetical protein K2P17_02975 [Helicobacteraceae bacterium]|nr:hypothetical protein [Helicobacteraceae bacterium]